MSQNAEKSANVSLNYTNVFAIWRFLKPNLGASTGPMPARDYIAESNVAAIVTAQYYEELKDRLLKLQRQTGDESLAGPRRAAFYCSQAQVVAIVAGEYAEILRERIQPNMDCSQHLDEHQIASITSQEFTETMRMRLANVRETAMRECNDGELIDDNNLQAGVANDTREEFESELETRIARLQNECYPGNPIGSPSQPTDVDNESGFSAADCAALTMPRLLTPEMPLIPTTRVVANITVPLTNTATFPLYVGQDAGLSKFEQLTLLLRQMGPTIPPTLAGSTHGERRFKFMLNAALNLVKESREQLNASLETPHPGTDSLGRNSPVSSTSTTGVVDRVDSADSILTTAAAMNSKPGVSATAKVAPSEKRKTVRVDSSKKGSKLKKSALPKERPKNAFSLASPIDKSFNVMTASAANSAKFPTATSSGVMSSPYAGPDFPTTSSAAAALESHGPAPKMAHLTTKHSSSGGGDLSMNASTSSTAGFEDSELPTTSTGRH